MIVIPCSEPAVIQHKKLASQLLRLFCKGKQLGFIEIEHAAFPVVINNGALPVTPAFRYNMAVDKPVHFLAQAIKAPVRIAENSLGGFQRGSVFHLQEQLVVGNTLHDPRQPLFTELSRGIVVTGPDQIKAVCFTGILIGIRPRKQKTGVGEVRGKARCALIHHT